MSMLIRFFIGWQVEDLRNRINDVSGEKLAMKQKLSDCEEELKKKVDISISYFNPGKKIIYFRTSAN